MISVPKGTVRSRKRLGRGAGSRTGCTAGRGTKGQKARSGGGVRLGFEGGQMPLYRRLPRRGFSNALFKMEPVIISLNSVDAHFDSGDTVSIISLHKKGLIASKDVYVKILSNGTISKSISVDETILVSKGAQEKIQAAGGNVANSHKKEGNENTVDSKNEDLNNES